MRILIVTPWHPTEDAPHSGVFVARDAAALAAEHAVRVLHLAWAGPATGRPLSAEGVATRQVRLRRLVPWDYLRARRLVRAAARDADVVHTHALPGLIPWFFGRPARIPWIHTEHWSGVTSPYLLAPAARAAAAVLRPLLRKPDVVVAACERLAAGVRRHRRGPIVIVPCVVAESLVVAPPPPPPLRLIGVGGLTPGKGPLLAVAAVAELRRRGSDARLTWVGDGPQRAEVEDEVRRLGLADRVRLTGALPPGDVDGELDRAHLLLLPTQGDNFCVAAAESLERGRPIVSGIDTGAVDYAAPAVSRFVAEQTGTAYADAVLDLWRETAAWTADEVAATVIGRFTPTTVRILLEDAYRVAAEVRGDRGAHDRAGRRRPRPV